MDRHPHNMDRRSHKHNHKFKHNHRTRGRGRGRTREPTGLVPITTMETIQIKGRMEVKMRALHGECYACSFLTPYAAYRMLLIHSYSYPTRSYLHVILLQNLHVLTSSFSDLSHCSSTFLTDAPIFPVIVRTCTGSAYGGQANSRPVARDDGAVGNIVPISAINPYSNKYVRTERFLE